MTFENSFSGTENQLSELADLRCFESITSKFNPIKEIKIIPRYGSIRRAPCVLSFPETRETLG